jgi:hypothetical protein
MVCLNKSLFFNKNKLKENLIKEINYSIKLDFNVFYNDKELKNIFNMINKHISLKIKDLFASDHFIYVNLDDNICSHKFMKGKNEGYFCQKKIRTNIIDGRKDFLCCSHSKLHISKKRISKKNDNLNLKLKSYTNTMTDKCATSDIYRNILFNNSTNYFKISNQSKMKFKKFKKRQNKIYLGNCFKFNFDKLLSENLIT